MKKILLSAVMLFVCSIAAFAQIPNGSFETWNVVNNDTVMGDGWNGNNFRVYQSISINTQQGAVVRNANAGTYFVGVFHAPDPNNAGQYFLGNFGGGFAFTQRPVSFTFSAMYFPQIQGEGLAIVITTKKNNGDTVSQTLGTLGQSTAANWTDLSLNLNYRQNVTGNPDSCFINFILLPTQTSQISPNTALFVDNLRFNSFGVSVEETMENYGKVGKVNVYPNPTAGNTSISYNLPVAQEVAVKLFDISGREVMNIFEGMQEAGEQTVKFNAENLAEGVYFYQLQAGSVLKTDKIVVKK